MLSVAKIPNPVLTPNAVNNPARAPRVIADLTTAMKSGPGDIKAGMNSAKVPKMISNDDILSPNRACLMVLSTYFACILRTIRKTILRGNQGMIQLSMNRRPPSLIARNAARCIASYPYFATLCGVAALPLTS